MNSFHKRVASKGRASLKHDNVVKLLYCYVYLRLLENYDKDVLDMVEDALVDAMETVYREAEQGAQPAPPAATVPQVDVDGVIALE
jgi:hypothetical protein